MFQPEALTKNEPLIWSTGKGTDVWEMFIAAMTGDLEKIKSLLHKDPSLIRCQYDYRTPMSFAVRENQSEVAAFLLEQGANPVTSGTDDTLLDIARERGYSEIQQLLEKAVAGKNGLPKGAIIAEAIRNRDLKKVQSLLNTSSELVNASDDGGNKPTHWAVMTRQPDIIDELLSRGADINAKRPDGARPIQLTNGDYEYRGWRDVPKDTVATPDDIYRHLISRGAYLDICMAALKGNTEKVRELLDQDPSLVNRVSDYVTYYPGSGAPIKNAAIGGHIEI